jgi:hypothetical protein
MPCFDAEEEKRLLICLDIVQTNPGTKLAKLAREKRVSYDKLRRRIRKVPDQRAKGGHNKRLNPPQEEGLKRYISYLIRIGQPPTKDGIRRAASQILLTCGEVSGCSKAWATRWLTRNKEFFKTIRAKTLPAERKAVHDREDVEGHFQDFQYALREFNILQDDVYNMDETGFRIGCLNGRVVITHTNTKAVYLADPEIRDWVTTIETIGAGGTTIPSMIILAGSVMLEKHFQNDLDDNTLLGITVTGYSNDIMGMEYIQHFHKMTEKRTKGKFRMLVFDGHGSHLSDRFTWYCWQHDIVPFRLLAHSTHLLQPLDVGIFQPLKHWHQVALHDSIQYGDLEYTKTDFLCSYETMRRRTFKASTILSAWKKVGLFPFDPSLVLDKMKVFEPDQLAPLETPMTPRRATMTYVEAPPQPFQTTPTTGNREAHRVYLNMRLFDYMELEIPLTPSYTRALVKYQRAVEPRVLEASAIKARDTVRRLAEIEKTRRKTGSGRHVQKNGVLYKGKGSRQIMERTEEEQAALDAVVNTRVQTKVKKTEKEYRKWVKLLPKNIDTWRDTAILHRKTIIAVLAELEYIIVVVS